MKPKATYLYLLTPLAFLFLVLAYWQCGRKPKPAPIAQTSPTVAPQSPKPGIPLPLTSSKPVGQQIRRAKTASAPKTPAKAVTSTLNGLPREIAAQMEGPLTPEKVRIKRTWANQPLYYYSGERVAGHDIPAGHQVTEQSPNANPMHDPPKCDVRMWAPCVLRSEGGKVYILGKCFNAQLQPEADCRSQMVRDVK